LEVRRVKRFFGVIVRGQSWLNVLYLLLAFPLGMFYFIFLTVGLSMGIGMAIVWVGIPILLVMVAAWWGFAAFERIQARYLLGVQMPPSPRPWEQAEGVLARLRAHFGSASTWKDLLFLFLKFPLGVFSFAVTVGVLALSDALLLAPLYFRFVDIGAHNGVRVIVQIDTLWKALIAMPIGAILLILSLHLLNAIAELFRVIAKALLAENGPAAARPPLAAGPPAQPAAATSPPPAAPAAQPAARAQEGPQ
jgi:hypothetical protein